MSMTDPFFWQAAMIVLGGLALLILCALARTDNESCGPDVAAAEDAPEVTEAQRQARRIVMEAHVEAGRILAAAYEEAGWLQAMVTKAANKKQEEGQ
jgi:hypothetical protein